MSELEPSITPLPVRPPRHRDRRLVGWIVTIGTALAMSRPAVLAVAAWGRPARRAFAPSFAERLPILLTDVLISAGVFLLGATLGSFLNVVVFRWPRGRSPLRGRSHCPACGQGIRALDNVPIVGWWRLGGRCRDCGAPISARYPIVEAICGAIVLAVWHFEMTSGGANLPLRAIDAGAGGDWIAHRPPADLTALMIYHCAVLLVTVVWSLVAADGGHVPWRHVAVVLVVAALVPVIIPGLHPVPIAGTLGGAGDHLVRGALVSAVGLATGALAGRLVAPIIGEAWWPIACLALWGAACGGQGALTLTGVLLGLVGLDRLAARLTTWLPVPASWLLLAAAVVQLLAWRQIHHLIWPA
ncbi:MAG: prepilin peptidase [Planctomycetaceae bacterium]